MRRRKGEEEEKEEEEEEGVNLAIQLSLNFEEEKM